ncbi:MAG: hypothetical protein Q9160_002306 [Pyrenula sp. 1 TL-2023]
MSNIDTAEKSQDYLEPSAEMDVDDLELKAQGYSRAMPRRFSTLSLMSMSYALLATWNGFGSAFGTGFTEASTAGSVWTVLIAAATMGVPALGMAELASAYPVAGAQYYWSFVVSTPEWAPFASYIERSACTSTIGWYLGFASVTNFVAAIIVGLAKLCWEGYEIERWHVYLVYVGVSWLAIGLNVFGSRLIPLWNKFILYLSFTTLIATFITLLTRASPHYQSAHLVFTDTTNSTGWSTSGLAFLFCILNAQYGFLGADSGAHLCEEIPSPTVNVPKVVLWPIVMGLVTTFPFAVALMFVIRDFGAVLESSTGLAIIEVYWQATGNKAATVVLMAPFALCLFGCACANVTSASRQVWSASRDRCLPGSSVLSRVSRRWEMPVWAACVQGVFVTVRSRPFFQDWVLLLIPGGSQLYGLIFLGSSSVFSSMVGATTVFFGTSYVIPQGILVWRGRDRVLPRRHLNLGRWGWWVNVLSVAWTILANVVYCIPVTRPVTAENMNWISVMVVFIVALMLVTWFVSIKHVFRGPSINMEMLLRARNETLKGVHVADERVLGPEKSEIVVKED